jgi:hypothetical protein
MSAETVLVVTPEVAKSLRRHSHRPDSIVERMLPRGLAKYLCPNAPLRQASEIQRLVEKWGGVVVPMHECVEGDLSTYFVVEDMSPGAAEALASEVRRRPGVRSSYTKPVAVLASGFEAGPYAVIDRVHES